MARRASKPGADRPRAWPALLPLHVVAEQVILIAQEQLALRDDRVRPDAAGLGPAGVLFRKLESALLLPPVRGGGDLHTLRAVLPEQVERPVRVANGPLLQTLFWVAVLL